MTAIRQKNKPRQYLIILMIPSLLLRRIVQLTEQQQYFDELHKNNQNFASKKTIINKKNKEINNKLNKHLERQKSMIFEEPISMINEQDSQISTFEKCSLNRSNSSSSTNYLKNISRSHQYLNIPTDLSKLIQLSSLAKNFVEDLDKNAKKLFIIRNIPNQIIQPQFPKQYVINRIILKKIQNSLQEYSTTSNQSELINCLLNEISYLMTHFMEDLSLIDDSQLFQLTQLKKIIEKIETFLNELILSIQKNILYKKQTVCRHCWQIFQSGRHLGGHISKCHPGISTVYLQKQIKRDQRRSEGRRRRFANCIIDEIFDTTDFQFDGDQYFLQKNFKKIKKCAKTLANKKNKKKVIPELKVKLQYTQSNESSLSLQSKQNENKSCLKKEDYILPIPMFLNIQKSFNTKKKRKNRHRI